ncbi:FAD binding domain-containing protein [Trichoderma breve]|uniref:FAD binding domain-containing protein n=1 Tax=Trichoderma breve TaxID=2034170 RepID=A0A9W9JSQ3_9HYPO|nr:FAD binding domain-containing protein [Trichoderma breve]KAJ4865516.1 FAD binding domain-containing protein [Trichoderma breve]
MQFQKTVFLSTQVPPASLIRNDIAAEIPGLLPLYDDFPDIVYTKADPVYETISPAFKKSTTTKPLAVVRPLNESHVQATIKAARVAGLPLGIRSGGLEMAGRNYKGTDKGILLDLRSLCSIHVSDDKASAIIGGGTIGVDLAVSLSKQGVFTPIGWHPRLGYAGWAMAGGYGLYSSPYGLGVDNILGARVVLADGSAVDVDDKNHPDLFWALRGAGNGIWGVVTQLTIKVYPPPNLLIGTLRIPKKDWPVALDKWANNIEPNLPDEFGGEVYFRNPVLDSPEMIIFFAWCAKEGEDIQKGWDYFEKIKSLPGAEVQRIAESDFATHITSEPSAQPVSYQVRGVVAKGLTSNIASVLNRQWTDPKIYSGIPCHCAHGNAIKPDPGACFPLRYRHRLFPLNSRHSELMGTEEGESLVAESSARLIDGIKATGDAYVGASYQNLIPPIDTDLEVTFGRETLEKLKTIKKKYDPENFFSRGYPALDV